MLLTLLFPALRDDMELYAISAGMVFPKLVSSDLE